MSNRIMQWLRSLVIRLNRWVGLEVVVAEHPERRLPTAEELIGDATPSEIMKTWRETIESAGGDSHKEFTKMFSSRLRPTDGWVEEAKRERGRTLRQVKWFQDFVRRNETTTVLPARPWAPPVPPSLNERGMTLFRTALDKALRTLPAELRVDATKWVMGELEKLEPKL